MDLSLITKRSRQPAPWQEGDNIPWGEPGFSRRMLKYHLAQNTDAASRRQEKIDRHVAWIHSEMLESRPAKVLDLGCGPGLYTTALAKLGHTCLGIDLGPASIDYARELVSREGLVRAEHICGDARTVDYGEGFDLAMWIFGEFNCLRVEHAELVLRKCHAALRPGGRLLLEPHTFAGIKAMGHEPQEWWASESGLFGDGPHVVVREAFWDETVPAATHRYFVIPAGGCVEAFCSSYMAYTDEAYVALLERCGFSEVTLLPSLGGVEQENLFAVTAVRK